MTDKHNWDNAIKDLNLMMEGNQRFVQAVGNNTLDNYEYSKNIQQLEKKLPEESKLKSYEASADMNHFIDDRTKVLAAAHELEELSVSEGLSTMRNFKDILTTGPQNAAEESLLNVAKTFLSPSEIELAAEEGLDAASVLNKANQSMVRDASIQIMLYEAREREMEESMRKQLDEVGVKDVSMSDLTEIIGVINAIEKELKETPVFEYGKDKEQGMEVKVEDAHDFPKSPDKTPDGRTDAQKKARQESFAKGE